MRFWEVPLGLRLANQSHDDTLRGIMVEDVLSNGLHLGDNL